MTTYAKHDVVRALEDAAIALQAHHIRACTDGDTCAHGQSLGVLDDLHTEAVCVPDNGVNLRVAYDRRVFVPVPIGLAHSPEIGKYIDVPDTTPYCRRVWRTVDSRGSLTFRRRIDGAVEVCIGGLTHAASGTDLSPFLHVLAVIPANEWASIISTCGQAGEDATTFAVALAFHTGGSAYDTNAHAHGACACAPGQCEARR